MEYTNILDMLHLGGIPVFAREREDAHPLVIAGGPVAFNPEPMADFIDIFVIGDGEESFPFFVDECLRLQRLGQSKSDILSHFAALDGFYVPARLATVQKDGFEVLSDNQPYPVPVKRHMVEDINAYPFPSDFVCRTGKSFTIVFRSSYPVAVPRGAAFARLALFTGRSVRETRNN
jgi:radical SAM superfamily enzyme YgiQ (UPF0313 family)